ncbi:MAG: sensor histidine kinase [Oleispira sp.]|nr:sensor histidine kinase [Oleispira sp.]MBL4880248.1 sensor histidine kinase [Oleispira sp.]
MLDRILLVACVLLFIGSAHSHATRFDLQRAGNHQLGQYIEYWEDTAAADPSLVEVSRLEQWQATTSDNINLGFSPSSFWFKSIINQQAADLNWFIRITYPPLDRIDLYLCQQEVISNIESECELTSTGDRIPFDQRARFNPNYIIPLDLQSGDNFLYIKVATEGSYQLPISIIDEQNLNEYLATNDFLRGGFLTLMLVMMLYNFFIYIMTGSPTYIRYSGFLFTFGLFYLTYEGSGFQFLWPQWPGLNQYAMPIAFALNLICLILFVVKFLNIKRTSIITYNYFNILLGLTAVALLLIPVIPYKLFITLMNFLSMIITGSAFYFGLRYWRQGQSAARLFTIAWAVFITGVVTANLRALGIIPSNFFTDYGYQIGSFIEIILLSLALGERIQRLEFERMVAKQALIQEKNDRMSALQQLIIGVSHEMNTPIGNIGLSNSFLIDIHQDIQKKELDLLSQSELLEYFDLQQQALDTIESSTKTLSSLTQVLKSVAIKKRDHPALEFDLVSLIQDRILTYGGQLTFQLSLPDSLVLCSHPSAFALVLDQLFENTVTHFPKNSRPKNAEVSITVTHDKHSLKLVIRDNGEGLGNTELAQLFLPFFTKARGSGKKMGLGMYQVKNIISDIFDGTIEACTPDNTGLQLTIHIPMLDNTCI